jgi:hypothetical protein
MVWRAGFWEGAETLLYVARFSRSFGLTTTALVCAQGRLLAEFRWVLLLESRRAAVYLLWMFCAQADGERKKKEKKTCQKDAARGMLKRLPWFGASWCLMRTSRKQLWGLVGLRLAITPLAPPPQLPGGRRWGKELPDLSSPEDSRSRTGALI